MQRLILGVAIAVFVGALVTIVIAARGDDETDTGTPAEEPDDEPGDDRSDEPAEPDTDLPIGGPYPVADLTFEIRPDGTDATAYTYRLACLGDTATLTGAPDPSLDEAQMCLALTGDEVRSRLIDGPRHEACTEQYGGPDTARVIGTIDDDAVDTTVDRANGCGIFDWDDVLGALLPPASGLLG